MQIFQIFKLCAVVVLVLSCLATVNSTFGGYGFRRYYGYPYMYGMMGYPWYGYGMGLGYYGMYGGAYGMYG